MKHLQLYKWQNLGKKSQTLHYNYHLVWNDFGVCYTWNMWCVVYIKLVHESTNMFQLHFMHIKTP
jgi:hypothetical protein